MDLFETIYIGDNETLKKLMQKASMLMLKANSIKLLYMTPLFKDRQKQQIFLYQKAPMSIVRIKEEERLSIKLQI